MPRAKLVLPKVIRDTKIDPQLLAQAVRVYLSNQRQGTKKTKHRGEVSGSGKKIWRQKGTGKARHGDRYAPLFVGGGVAHGPTGKENYERRLPRKMRQKALIMALKSKFNEGELVITDNKLMQISKTKDLVGKLRQVAGYDDKKWLLLVVPPGSAKDLWRASGNLAKVRLTTPEALTAYQVLTSRTVVITPDGFKATGDRGQE